MNWLPYGMHTVHTDLAPYQIAERLRAITGWGSVEWNGFWLAGDHKPYVGEVSDDGFSIRRRHVFANPVEPMLKGSVKAVRDGSKISMRMVPTPIAGTFVAIWIALWTIMGLLAIFKTVAAGRLSWSAELPLALGIGFYLSWLAFFHVSGWRHIRDLEDTFLSHTRPPSSPESRGDGGRGPRESP